MTAPDQKERIAKRLARLGVASRRQSEHLIADGRISVNGIIIDTPACLVGDDDQLSLDGNPLKSADKTRLWRYYKPNGLVTTHYDPEGRTTVFEVLPDTLPRVISVGRLDLTSEGLLLLTNDGTLSRQLEHPQTGLRRTYRVKVFGHVQDRDREILGSGMTIDGIRYAPIDGVIERHTNSYSWVTLHLTEGKNREIRKVMEALGYPVTRLIRTAYGPFELGDLAEGAVSEIPFQDFQEFLI